MSSGEGRSRDGMLESAWNSDELWDWTPLPRVGKGLPFSAAEPAAARTTTCRSRGTMPDQDANGSAVGSTAR